jgi:hypothetical protein
VTMTREPAGSAVSMKRKAQCTPHEGGYGSARE